MNQLPAPAAATALVGTLPPNEAAIERFLARVAALTPRQWGELDAEGQRLGAGDPVARWRRARRTTAPLAALPVLRDLATVWGLAYDLFFDAQSVVLGRGRMMRRLRLVESRPVHRSADVERIARAVHALHDLALARPGGPGAALSCLNDALTALEVRQYLPPDAFAELYGPVEAFIPAASLG